MERRILTFVERRGYADLTSYLAQMGKDGTQIDAFLDRVTNNVSQLWRTPEQWTVLAREVLPELAGTGRLQIWSAGCSYGAEAYTLAAICRAVVPAARTEIRGTDIDPSMIERAQTGHFSTDDGRGAPKAELRSWFEEQVDGSWQARRELQRMTRFEVGDLLRLRPRTEAYDLVLCRNTIIYFNEEVRDDLHAASPSRSARAATWSSA